MVRDGAVLAEQIDAVLERQISPLFSAREAVRRLPKHQLGVQHPRLRQLPLPADRVCELRQEIVVLQIGPEAFEFQGSPGDELVHAGGMLGPWEAISGRAPDITSWPKPRGL